MRHSLWLLFASATAVAAPVTGRPIKAVNLEIDHEHVIILAGTPATEEPGGMRVPDDAGDEWREIGLLPGDTVRDLNGSALSEQLVIGSGVSVLEIQRGGKPLLLRLVIHDPSPAEVTLSDAQWKDMLDSISGRTPLATPMMHDGRPSGVRVVDMLLALNLRLDTGDIVRAVAGVPIRNADGLLNALHDLPVGDTPIEIDRGGRRITVTVTREAPIDFTGIHATGKNHYEVPRMIAEEIEKDARLVVRGLDSTPFVDAGKVRGTKLFAIDPASLAAALGLHNDDIVLDVEGKPLDTFEHIYSAVYDLRDATSLTVHLERHGKPLALTYEIQ